MNTLVAVVFLALVIFIFIWLDMRMLDHEARITKLEKPFLQDDDQNFWSGNGQN